MVELGTYTTRLCTTEKVALYVFSNMILENYEGASLINWGPTCLLLSNDGCFPLHLVSL